MINFYYRKKLLLCLVNTAIAVAGDPVEMAKAFKEAVVCGRRAYEAGLGKKFH